MGGGTGNLLFLGFRYRMPFVINPLELRSYHSKFGLITMKYKDVWKFILLLGIGCAPGQRCERQSHQSGTLTSPCVLSEQLCRALSTLPCALVLCPFPGSGYTGRRWTNFLSALSAYIPCG